MKTAEMRGVRNMYYKGYEHDVAELLKGENRVKLNFANPGHVAFYMKSHGGEEMIRRRYPAVYQSLKETGMRASLRTANGNQEEICECFVKPPVFLKKGTTNESVMEFKAQAQANVKIKKDGGASPVVSVYMDGSVENPLTHDHFASIWDEFEGRDLRDNNGACISNSDGRFSGSDDTGLTTSCRFEYIDADGRLHVDFAMDSANAGDLNVDAIASFDITDPKSADEKKNPITITYKGRSGFNPDYDRSNVEPVGGAVRVVLPMGGTVEFKDGYKPVGLSDHRSKPISLYYEGDMSVPYNHTIAEYKNRFSIQGRKVTFQMDEDWKSTFSSEKFTRGLTASLDCPFRYLVDGPDRQYEIPLSITSRTALQEGEVFYHSTGRDVYVPQIQYWWGCFRKDTRIRMADHTERQVNEIRVGDQVAVFEGQPATVCDILMGMERSLCHIETENGRWIEVSDTHPVMTARGPVSAMQINITDRIVMEDGSFSGIRYLYLAEYQDAVYNLNLGQEPHMIFANGFVAGDFQSQNRAPVSAPLILKPEVKELLEQMFCLRRELER